MKDISNTISSFFGSFRKAKAEVNTNVQLTSVPTVTTEVTTSVTITRKRDWFRRFYTRAHGIQPQTTTENPSYLSPSRHNWVSRVDLSAPITFADVTCDTFTTQIQVGTGGTECPPTREFGVSATDVEFNPRSRSVSSLNEYRKRDRSQGNYSQSSNVDHNPYLQSKTQLYSPLSPKSQSESLFEPPTQAFGKENLFKGKAPTNSSSRIEDKNFTTSSSDFSKAETWTSSKSPYHEDFVEKYKHDFKVAPPPSDLPKDKHAKWERSQMLRHSVSTFELRKKHKEKHIKTEPKSQFPKSLEIESSQMLDVIASKFKVAPQCHKQNKTPAPSQHLPTLQSSVHSEADPSEELKDATLSFRGKSQKYRDSVSRYFHSTGRHSEVVERDNLDLSCTSTPDKTKRRFTDFWAFSKDGSPNHSHGAELGKTDKFRPTISRKSKSSGRRPRSSSISLKRETGKNERAVFPKPTSDAETSSSESE